MEKKNYTDVSGLAGFFSFLALKILGHFFEILLDGI